MAISAQKSIQDRTAFMTGGFEHHWLRLEEGNGQGVKRIGFEVASEQALVQLGADLKGRGLEIEEDRPPRWAKHLNTAVAEVARAPLH